MMMNRFYTPVNQDDIEFYKFKSFEYYCEHFVTKKKKKLKFKVGKSQPENKGAFVFEQNGKFDALLDKFFSRMNNPPDFSIENELYKKITEETEQFIKENKKILSIARKDVIFCIKKILKIKEKIEYFNTHFFSNSINIIVFIRTQVNLFYESKPNLIFNPNLNNQNDNSAKLSKNANSVSKNSDKIDYNYTKAGYEVECPVDALETFFENEYNDSLLIQKSPRKIMSLCSYIQKNLVGRFQQIDASDISQTITAMSQIYDPDLLYIIPNIVDDFLGNYIQYYAPKDYEELKNISVQVMARNFYNCLHHKNQPKMIYLSSSQNSSTNFYSQSDTKSSISNISQTQNENDEKKDSHLINDKKDNEIKNDDKKDNLLTSDDKTDGHLENDDKKSDSDDESDNQINIKTCEGIIIESCSEDYSSSEDLKPEEKLTESQKPSTLLTKLSSVHIFNDQDYNKISFSPLRKFITKYCKVFNIQYSHIIVINNEKKTRKKKATPQIKLETVEPPTNERMVLRCSFVRILCNIIYTNFPGFLYEPMNPKFFHACEIVKLSTPKEMEINPKIICDYMMNTSFKFLVESVDLYSGNISDDISSSSDQIILSKKRKRSKTFNSYYDKNVHDNELKKASNLINETQFLTNPIDIIYHIHCALNLINEFYQKCGVVRKYGSLSCLSKENEERILKNASFLAFDDIFPLFCMVIAYSAPSNAVAVGDFLARTEDLKLGSQFDFSKLLFTSAIEYMIKDVEKDLMKVRQLEEKS